MEIYGGSNHFLESDTAEIVDVISEQDVIYSMFIGSFHVRD